MNGTSDRKVLDATDAVYFDGDVPLACPVTLALINAETVLEITLADGRVALWPAGDMLNQPDVAGRTHYVLRWIGDPLARLVTPNPFLLRALPHPTRAAPPKGRGRLFKWALAAVAAVALQIGVLIPLLADNLAGFIPAEGERALGAATFGHIREALDETGLNPLAVCDTPDGGAALTDLVTRLGPDGGFDPAVTVAVLDHDMINAFALPGGFVVIFRGLIDAADGPDEVAAVLAHEIGHVVSRDPTRHALRSAGSIGVLGLLFGDFAGGTAVLFLTERLISAQYSQAAENGADDFAHHALAAAGISPGALGQMFESLKAKHGDSSGIAAHFISHPALSQRISAAQAAVDPKADYIASMSDAEWSSVQNICK
jgi:Zn-dependent protease with chaperone function